MSGYEIEIILNRRLADCLAIPVFLTDTKGNLIYYNEPAEAILGTRYNETGMMPAAEWATIFHPVDHEGKPIPAEELPLVIAVSQHHPAHKIFWIRGMDGNLREIEVTALPLVGQADRFLGGIAIFWERSTT